MMGEMLALSIENGAGTRRHDLSEDARLVLGRAPHCDLVVDSESDTDTDTDTDTVQPEHACIERIGDRLRLVALSSEHPVRLNDQLVTEADLAAGDRVDLGDTAVHVLPNGTGSRLAGLARFAESAADDAEEIAGAIRSGGDGRRIAFDGDGPDELPDLDHLSRSLRRILEASRRLTRAADESELRERVLDTALLLLGGDVAALVAVEGAEPLEVLCARDAAGETEPASGVGGLALLAGEATAGPLAVEDLALDGAGDRAAVAAALPGGGEVLVVASRSETGLYGATDARLLILLGEQTIQAREHIGLRGRVAKQEAELTQAGQRAERLNRRLSELLERRTLELRETRERLARVDAAEGFANRYSEIVGRGPAMLTLLRQVDRVAATSVPVLFEGESGTGKELMARALHHSSDRASAPFVAENCAALPDTLLENELFGHERGAYTGAESVATGLFERADGGTLFLDEVGDMSPSLQTRLLRVLQEGEVRRVGGSTVHKVDVRVVAATNRDLLAMVQESRFREDLYYRLAVVKIRVPPLRERREDVPALVGHFLETFSETGLPIRCTDEALDALLQHSWPGNIRELQNEIRRSSALSRGMIDVDSLSPEVREARPAVPEMVSDPMSHLRGRDLRSLVAEVEIRVLRSVLDDQNGNITRTARAVGLSRLGLRKKMQRYGLQRDGQSEGREGRSQVRS